MGEGAFSFDVEESLTRFEAPFADVKSGAIYTTTFHMGEPVLYHPPHKASPVATHVTQITRDFFTCGDTTIGRMMPLRMAHKCLVKLSLVDIEVATKGAIHASRGALAMEEVAGKREQADSRETKDASPMLRSRRQAHLLAPPKTVGTGNNYLGGNF